MLVFAYRLTVECAAESACLYTDITCLLNENSISKISCLVDGACELVYANIESANKLTVNHEGSSNTVFRCDSFGNNCFGIYDESLIITCTAGKHCDVDCPTPNMDFFVVAYTPDTTIAGPC